MISNSSIFREIPQADGRIDVTERHDHADGTVQYVNYLADPSIDLQIVANTRASNINNELTRRAAEIASASNFEIPLTDIEVMKRITPAEWAAFQTSTNPNIAYYRAIFAKTRTVNRTDPLTVLGFNTLVSEGILTEARVAEVLA